MEQLCTQASTKTWIWNFDMSSTKQQVRQKEAVTRIIREVADSLDLNASVILWDETRLPLGKDVTSPLAIRIKDPGLISSMLRWPSLDKLIRYYAHGYLDIEGGSIIDLGEQLVFIKSRKKLKHLNRAKMLRELFPFLFSKGLQNRPVRDFDGDEEGEKRDRVDNTAFVAFHYDLSNEFYSLFLDPEMVYTCAYFTDADNSLAQAQLDKMDMICRKLRLQRGDRFLDIGCGWGGLLCHAARHYGVEAYGISLSVEQLEYARLKIKEQNLEKQVRVEFRDYADLPEVGMFDKIASIGMYEAIGVDNIENYFQVIRSVLADGGLFLNHGITRRFKRKKGRFSHRAEQKARQKYILPGGELDDLGSTIQRFENTGYEVHDVEGWREHYAITTRHWCERLTENREAAIALVGEEAYRIWVAYLGGVSFSFQRGTARIYQILASGSAKGPSAVPLTRSDIYQSENAAVRQEDEN